MRKRAQGMITRKAESPNDARIGEMGFWKNFDDYKEKRPGGFYWGINAIRVEKGWWYNRRGGTYAR